MYKLSDIPVQAGVDPDNEPSSTVFYTDMDRMRFYRGAPETLGGWQSVTFDNSAAISGCPRSIFSLFFGSKTHYIIGTNLRLYDLVGSQLTNITPQKTATTAIANSLDTNFFSLGASPVDTTSGSATVTVNATGIDDVVVVGDVIEIAGATTTNGIPNTELNADHIVRSVSTDAITIIVSTAASSTGSGGGGSVTLGTRIISVNATAHGQLVGDRVTIAAATATGGIGASEINVEHIIRNVSTNAFDIVVATTQATSAVTGGGGASTTFAEQIDAGECDATAGSGYGAGLYGAGIYGSALQSTTANIPPRIWSTARYGNLVLTTAGNQTGLYEWDGSTVTAPVLVTNAPTAINYVFVDRNIVVTLGASGVGNRIKWSDAAARTTWTAGTNYANEDDIEGANDFITQANVRGVNLLFTDTQVYTFRYIDLPFVWETKLLSPEAGIIGQNARVVANGICYWMGQDNFYYYASGAINKMPRCTILKYVFDNINNAQKEKVVAWHNEKFNEIWFFYPSSSSAENDRYAVYGVDEQTWAYGGLERTAAEYPAQKASSPRLINSSGTLYQHETGVNDDGAAMDSFVETPYFSPYTEATIVGGIVYANVMEGNATLTVTTRKYVMDSTTEAVPVIGVSFDNTTGRQAFIAEGRYWKYRIDVDEIDANWRGGRWRQEIKGGPPEDT